MIFSCQIYFLWLMDYRKTCYFAHVQLLKLNHQKEPKETFQEKNGLIMS